jgi:hypothetical protein
MYSPKSAAFGSCVDILVVGMDRSGDAPPLGVDEDGVAVALLAKEKLFQVLLLLLLLLLLPWPLRLLLEPCMSMLDETREGPLDRCDGGIDIGGASL